MSIYCVQTATTRRAARGPLLDRGEAGAEDAVVSLQLLDAREVGSPRGSHRLVLREQELDVPRRRLGRMGGEQAAREADGAPKRF